MRTKLIKVHNIMPHLIVQLDKFNGPVSVAMLCATNPINMTGAHNMVSQAFNLSA